MPRPNGMFSLFFIVAQQNERDIIRPITIILDGPASYHTWSQNMRQYFSKVANYEGM